MATLARDMDPALVGEIPAGMYVNLTHLWICGESANARKQLLDMGYEAGLIPPPRSSS